MCRRPPPSKTLGIGVCWVGQGRWSISCSLIQASKTLRGMLAFSSDRYFRLQPRLTISTAELDNASRENIAELKRIAKSSLEENRAQLDTLVPSCDKRPKECQRVVDPRRVATGPTSVLDLRQVSL